MIKWSKFTGRLLPHQQEALDKLDKTDAMLMYHSLGAGKTATSIAGSQDRETDVIVPASLRENYKKEILEEEGRVLTGEQAAIEWINKYAKDFDKEDQ